MLTPDPRSDPNSPVFLYMQYLCFSTIQIICNVHNVCQWAESEAWEVTGDAGHIKNYKINCLLFKLVTDIQRYRVPDLWSSITNSATTYWCINILKILLISCDLREQTE